MHPIRPLSPSLLARRRLLAVALATVASVASASVADAATRTAPNAKRKAKPTKRATRAAAVKGPIKVPQRLRRTAAHRAYNQAKAAGLIDGESSSASMPSGVTGAVSAGITDSNGAAGGYDDITLVTTGSGKNARSYFAGNRYSGVATRKTGEVFEVHGPFRVDAVGTLEGAAPVVSAAGVDADALARETGATVELGSGGSEKPSWFGRASRTVLARGDDAVRQFHAAHLDRSIHRSSAALALNSLATAGKLKNPRMIRFSQKVGDGVYETVDVLVFRDGAGKQYKLLSR